jgi:broad-specificity NMP kinase
MTGVVSVRPFIVVSGIPGSGKTTLATKLAEALVLPLLDKDHILEALFAGEGAISPEVRQRLSRASDNVLAALAATTQGSVIVPFWRHPQLDSHSGDLPPSWSLVHCESPWG